MKLPKKLDEGIRQRQTGHFHCFRTRVATTIEEGFPVFCFSAYERQSLTQPARFGFEKRCCCLLPQSQSL